MNTISLTNEQLQLMDNLITWELNSLDGLTENDAKGLTKHIERLNALHEVIVQKRYEAGI